MSAPATPQPRTPIQTVEVGHHLGGGLPQIMAVRRALFHEELARPALMAGFHRPLRTAEGRKAFVHFARCIGTTDLLEAHFDAAGA